MADVHGRSSLSGAAPKIAIGAAVVALLTSVIAVVVVASRSGGEGTAAGTTREPSVAGVLGPPIGPPEQRVSAIDVVRLKREVLERAPGSGVKVIDADVRKGLGLQADDVITSFAGRPIEREYDVYDALLGVGHLRATVIYVDLIRSGRPTVVRWRIDGDLNAARRSALGSMGGTSDPFGTGTGVGGLSGLGGGNDPLADTIKRIDPMSYEVPRSTVDRVLSSTSTYARLARTLPARPSGFKLYAVRPGILTAIGLANGDTVRAINGHEVSSVDEALEVYQQIKDAKEWRIDLTRRGSPEVLKISIK